MISLTDEELVRKHLAGDELAFSILFSRYRGRVHRFCIRLLQDFSLSEDVVQSTFTVALERMSTLDSPKLFYYWLFTIARNQVYGILREKKRNGNTSIEMDDSVWTAETPHEQLIHQETTEIVQSCLEQLKLEYREVLVLRQFEKLSYSEIASITGDSISSVESRLFKARKALAKKLAPYFSKG